MIDFTVRGAIFDVDDTLLDNKEISSGFGLHERSRLAAAHAVGKRHSIAALQQFSAKRAREAFVTAPVHTMQAAVWNMLSMCGLVDGIEPDPNDRLLQEIMTLKNELHKDILQREGEAFPGAIRFVAALADSGLQDKLAIASTAVSQDVEVFFAKTELNKYFPPSRIITVESITHGKPHPEAFNLAFASLKLPERDRQHVCAFEDDPRGITAAHAAGLYVCAITSRYSKEALLKLTIPPDVIAASYAEFSRLFGL